MLRLLSALTWTFACCVFFLLGATFLAYRYVPDSWDAFFPPQVLGESVVVSALEEASSEAEGRESAGALAKTADARAHLVANFIERNDTTHTSPLQPYEYWGQLFVEIADEYGLDFRLLPAIARKESTFCKSNIALTYFNCFGYGVPASGITEAGKFSSFEEGARVVAASLKKSYLDKGLTDPEAIMQKYCPPSGGSWADHLNQWLEEMRYDDKQLGGQTEINVDLTEFTDLE
jgi:hypothetical protein